MSNHSICFCGEIRKIFYEYPLLSGTMVSLLQELVQVTAVLKNNVLSYFSIKTCCCLKGSRYTFKGGNMSKMLLPSSIMETNSFLL